MKKFWFFSGILLLILSLCAGCGANNHGLPKDGEARAIVMDMTTVPGLYVAALEELYHKDAALNNNIEMVAFDFSRCSNLTNEEKAALMDYVSKEWNLTCWEGTFAELKEKGHITEEDGFHRFEKGILISVETEQVEENAFTFSVGKFRSSLGAYMLCDCEASFGDGVWSYTVGAEMIS